MAICEDCPEWEDLIQDFDQIKEHDPRMAEKGRFVIAMLLNEGKCSGPRFVSRKVGIDEGYYVCDNELIDTSLAVDNWATDSMKLDLIKIAEQQKRREREEE